jgi:hypothetical protein
VTLDGKEILTLDKPALWVAVSFEKNGPKAYSGSKTAGLAVAGKQLKAEYVGADTLLRPAEAGDAPRILIRK